MGFLKVLQNVKKYDNKHALATWIRNILVNHLIDEFRKNQKYITQVHLSDFSEDDGGISINAGAKKLEEQELRDLLKQLPPVTQTVFNLYAIDGYKHKEIASQMKISEGTSKWHVNHARKVLRVLVGELYKETNETMELGK